MTTELFQSSRFCARVTAGAVVFASLAPALATCACGPVEPAGTPGVLKEGGFVYCEDTNAAPCPADMPVPDHIAVGSTFALEYSDSLSSSSVDSATLTSSDERKLAALATSGPGVNGFQALAAGAATVDVRDPKNDRVIDFVRLDLEDIDLIEIVLCPRAFNAITTTGGAFDRSECGGSPLGGSTVNISMGDALAPTVCALPLDAGGDELAGRLPFQWLMNDSDADLEIFVGEDERCATVGGLTQGAASVTIEAGTTGVVLSLTVGP